MYTLYNLEVSHLLPIQSLVLKLHTLEWSCFKSNKYAFCFKAGIPDEDGANHHTLHQVYRPSTMKMCKRDITSRKFVKDRPVTNEIVIKQQTKIEICQVRASPASDDSTWVGICKVEKGNVQNEALK